MTFIFSCFHHSKMKVISSRRRVISSIYIREGGLLWRWVDGVSVCIYFIAIAFIVFTLHRIKQCPGFVGTPGGLLKHIKEQR